MVISQTAAHQANSLGIGRRFGENVSRVRAAHFPMTRLRLLPLFFPIALSLIPAAGLSIHGTRPAPLPLPSAPQSARSYLGFDLNTYPGDDALPILRKSFAFAGYWLSPPPGAKINTWRGKREALRSQGFGFLVLFTGPQIATLNSAAHARRRAASEAHHAATAARAEGFPHQTVIFLDIEEGGRLPAAYHAYLRAWVDGLLRGGYRAGVYCSGMPVSEGEAVTITTADDIRENLGPRAMKYWVYNDACPPSPGCATTQNSPAPSASGIPYAAIWQFAQSPRRKEFTARCAATYSSDGNCYAPGDGAHAWFLDVDTATSQDPSGGVE
jgi:Domain of unknown function (DUF1906)